MENKLDDILEIRNLRKNLSNLDISNNEKEVLRRCYNYYENLLNLSIVKSNLNKEELENHNVKSDIDVIDVPVEDNSDKYKEYSDLPDYEVVPIINELSSNYSDRLTLTSLKEYCNYLKQLDLIRKNNNDIFDDVFGESIKL